MFLASCGKRSEQVENASASDGRPNSPEARPQRSTPTAPKLREAAQAAASGEEPEGEDLTEDPEEVERKRIFDEAGQRVTPALLATFSEDSSARAALVYAQAMKDGMKTNYHSELEGRNDVALVGINRVNPCS